MGVPNTGPAPTYEAPSSFALLAWAIFVIETPTIFPGPSSLFAAATPRSPCPMCTPSASTAAATSTRSFMMSGTLRRLHIAASALAFFMASGTGERLSRNCIMSAPPLIAAAAAARISLPRNSSPSRITQSAHGRKPRHNLLFDIVCPESEPLELYRKPSIAELCELFQHP